MIGLRLSGAPLRGRERRGSRIADALDAPIPYHTFGIECEGRRHGQAVGKQQLTDQAIVLFLVKGYSAVSIDEIVKARGITKVPAGRGRREPFL